MSMLGDITPHIRAVSNLPGESGRVAGHFQCILFLKKYIGMPRHYAHQYIVACAMQQRAPSEHTVYDAVREYLRTAP